MIASSGARHPAAGRVIAHVDMDAFFAAVEVRERPELAGKPVIVGGRRDSRRGVVATCSYEARRYGVRSAMPIRRAVELCPQGIFLEPRHHLYRQVSDRILEVLHTFSPLVEPVSIDEAYLDVTADRARFESLEALGRAIKTAIHAAERLTASVGIAPNKFLAKLATTLSKPNGLMVVEPSGVDRLLLPLAVDHLPGVGPRTAARLREMGIHRVADVRARPRSYLAERLGRFGETLYELAMGIDPRPVQPPQPARSLSAEQTYEEDITAPEQVRARLAELAAEVGRRLRAEGFWARTVVLKARYPDFVTLTRRVTLREPTADDALLFETAYALWRQLPPRPGGFRLLGVGAESLTRFSQPLLWEAPEGSARQAQVDRLVDAINTRYDRVVVGRGRIFKAVARRSPRKTRDDAGG
ncbi:MAG: DNA polymerase IV [Limnochordaceae bacterium]|nr:DNA polymerase IV [Limnochordaceae bacterium]